MLWGFGSQAQLDAELARQNLISTSIRVRRSWDPPDPDSTIGMVETKVALGEFAYSVNPSTGAVTVDSAWKNANISAGSIGQLTLRSGCHVLVRQALTNAMNEVIASGLASTINYAHANTAGGCYVPRFSRDARAAVPVSCRVTPGAWQSTPTRSVRVRDARRLTWIVEPCASSADTASPGVGTS